MKYAVLALLLTSLPLATAQAQDYGSEIAKAKFLDPQHNGRPATEADTTLLASAGLKRVEKNYLNDCDEPATIHTVPLNLGSGLSDATAVFVSGSSACYGKAGYALSVLDNRGRILWNNAASAVAILPSTRDGVHNLSFYAPDSTRSVWHWNLSRHQYDRLMTVSAHS